MLMLDILHSAANEGLAPLYQKTPVVENVKALEAETLSHLKGFIPLLEQLSATEIDEAKRRAQSLACTCRLDVDTDALAVLLLLHDASRYNMQHLLMETTHEEIDHHEEAPTWDETPIAVPQLAAAA
jgi:hypothetical protein